MAIVDIRSWSINHQFPQDHRECGLAPSITGLSTDSSTLIVHKLDDPPAPLWDNHPLARETQPCQPDQTSVARRKPACIRVIATRAITIWMRWPVPARR